MNITMFAAMTGTMIGLGLAYSRGFNWFQTKLASKALRRAKYEKEILLGLLAILIGEAGRTGLAYTLQTNTWKDHLIFLFLTAYSFAVGLASQQFLVLADYALNWLEDKIKSLFKRALKKKLSP
jgi:CDP-diglyceride synthetase